MESAEVDWDDVVFARRPLESEEGGEDAAQPDLGLVPYAAQEEAQLGAVRHRNLRAMRTSKWEIKLPPPRQRARDQNVLAACRMREVAAENRKRQLRSVARRQANDALDVLRRRGLVLLRREP